MEDGVYFSASLASFIPQAWKDDGTYDDENWPTDAVLLTDEEKKTFWKQNPPDDKQLGDSAGRPVWVDIPAPTKDESVAAAVQTQKSLLQDINDETQIWQTQLTLGIITDDDKATLITWMKYAQAVQAIDTSKAPDITWPTKPS
ncbi:hypothetical protein VH86_04120 [Pantoea sp. BL1]|uniref:tail fiber assembly protein n=1 Tax=Pantoea sp. BL1 TaxID=1628190 RepID=UPI0005F775E6|nr:tail assembly chaperone [Pantoea sp. BL1]KJV49674.1 hypothetical protein VH86_04120 [Pantoea sp. BL1]